MNNFNYPGLHKKSFTKNYKVKSRKVFSSEEFRKAEYFQEGQTEVERLDPFPTDTH